MGKSYPECRVPLRGALIGFGNVAIHAHLPVWRESRDFSIRGIVEPLPERAELAAEMVPEARLYPDMETLLREDGFDFVDICTPPCFHAETMLKACRSGLHVFCEKPLVTSMEGIAEIQASAQEFNRVVFSVNNWKHAPLWAKAREIIRENRIGRVRKVDLSVLRTPGSGGGVSDWRRSLSIAGGGILVDHGWHHFYLILSLVQEHPSCISAKFDHMAEGSGLEETADLHLRFPDAEATLHMTWRAPERRNYGAVTGDRGSLLVNDDHLVLMVDGLPPCRYDFPEALSGGSHHRDWMRPVVEDFHREILNTTLRGSNFLEAKWCAWLTESAYRSHREGACFIQVDGQVF
jgi:predicted dehydrogenase